jgi:hypothetical protein
MKVVRIQGLGVREKRKTLSLAPNYWPLTTKIKEE